VAPEDIAKMERRGPLDRHMARPEEVAAAVLYVASERAGFTTGQIVTVDGGTLL
jgi:3-oxoacyl-[acyl-carrier protein] reductase